jgi:hypothetical protein
MTHLSHQVLKSRAEPGSIKTLMAPGTIFSSDTPSPYLYTAQSVSQKEIAPGTHVRKVW